MERVTDILKRCGLGSEMPFLTPEQQEYYKNRGTQIHAASGLVDKGTLDWDKLDTRIVEYVKAYQKFIRDSEATVIASELEVTSKKHKYVGHLDKVFLIGKFKVVCDLKTSMVPVSTRLQTMAYRIAYKCPTARRMGLALHDNGTYRAHWWLGDAMDAVDMNGWLACLKGDEQGIDKWKQIVGWKEKKG